MIGKSEREGPGLLTMILLGAVIGMFVGAALRSYAIRDLQARVAALEASK